MTDSKQLSSQEYWSIDRTVKKSTRFLYGFLSLSLFSR
jgi:hypothetical protein